MIRFSQLASNGSNRRIDPEFFSKRFMENQRIIEASLYAKKSLVDITTKIDVGYVSSMVHEYVDSGIPLLQTQNIHQFLVDYSDCIYISPEFHYSLNKSQVFPGDCLIARSGTIGNTAFILENDPQPLNSADIIIVRADGDKVTNGYLAAFLNSKIGGLQVERYTSGGVQGHINLKSIEHILVPLTTKYLQGAIDSVVRNGMVLYHNASELFGSAEQTLLKALGLEGWQPPEPLTYVRKASEAFAEARLDAEYYAPAYDALLDHISEKGKIRLRDAIREPVRRGISPEYVEDGDLIVINSQHVGKTHITLNDNRKTSNSLVNKKNHRSGFVVKGDVLLNSTGVITIGRCQCLIDEVQAVVDNHVAIIRPAELLDPVYLACFLNSKPGLMQTERGYTGSSGQIELRPEVVEDYLIWLAPKEIQDSIKQSIEMAYSARAKSKTMLDRAKHAVEIAIEQGEAAAMEYLDGAKD